MNNIRYNRIVRVLIGAIIGATMTLLVLGMI